MSWLKFDCATPEKPEVIRITIAMGWDDPDTTVGKLLKVWRWFDAHSVDGNAHGVTLSLLDRLIGVTGLAQAMTDAGWLVVTDDGLNLPNFENHNGKTAKDRALTAKRAANHRSNGKSNAMSVTTSLPREEKRREEKIENKEGRRATRIAPDFDPKPEPEAESGIDRQKELANFRDYWSSKARDNTKLDWQATWRQWARKADRPAINRFAKPDPFITVPGRASPDPELIRLEMESKNATPMPDHIREHIKRIKGQA